MPDCPCRDIEDHDDLCTYCSEPEPCLKGTVGCCVVHPDQGDECATW